MYNRKKKSFKIKYADMVNKEAEINKVTENSLSKKEEKFEQNLLASLK